MKAGGHEDVLEEDDSEYEQGDTFLSFHRQAKRSISRKALLAGFGPVKKMCDLVSAS